MYTEEIFFNINVASDYLPIVSLFCNKGWSVEEWPIQIKYIVDTPQSMVLLQMYDL